MAHKKAIGGFDALREQHRCRTCERMILLTETHCPTCSKTIAEHRQHPESWDTKHYMTRDR